MPPLAFRTFLPGDLDRVAGIESRIAGQSRKPFLERRLSLAASAPEDFLSCVATDGESPAGYLFARLAEDEEIPGRRIAILDVLGVDPEFQGTGIGKALIAELEKELGGRGIRTLRTEVDWANSGMVRFFSAVGFLVAPGRIYERRTERIGEESRDDRTHSRGGLRIRSLVEEDLPAVVRIDRKHTGRDRTAFYAGRFREMRLGSGIRASLAVEEDRFVVGFVMARVDFGEFGKVDRSAVIDTLGVHPAYGRSGIGRGLLSHLLHNLSTLQVESVRARVPEGHFALQRFLSGNGFSPSQRLLLCKTVA
ncbi:MAG: hypothetical protein Kow00128_22900 [Deltaproteobacteria bacterium]